MEAKSGPYIVDLEGEKKKVIVIPGNLGDIIAIWKLFVPSLSWFLTSIPTVPYTNLVFTNYNSNQQLLVWT